MKRTLILFSIMMISIFSGCNIVQSEDTNQEGISADCIPPIVGASYPVLVKERIEEIAPGFPWRRVSEIPNLPDEENLQFADYKIFTPEETDHVWVIVEYYLKESFAGKINLWLYNTKTSEWENKQNALEVFYPDLHSMSVVNSYSGNIYVFQETSSTEGPGKPNTIARYNKNSDSFEVVQFASPLPDGNLIYDKENEVFWGIAYDGVIFRIDPNGLGVKDYFKSENARALYSISKDVQEGAIYGIIDINANSPDNSYKNNLIYKLSTENGKEEIIVNPIQKDDFYNSTALDSSGNLWLNDHSLMTMEGKWYQILRSPIFITDRIKEMNDQYVWDNPKIVLVSSDYIWFRSLNGISWYKPDTGEWCWVTNQYSSDPVEGKKNDLWMISNGILYVNEES